MQEHLSHLLKYHSNDLKKLVHCPRLLNDNDDNEYNNNDDNLWIYEHIRYITKSLNTPWITSLQQHCYCQNMTANDWKFVCVSHSRNRKKVRSIFLEVIYYF